MTAPDEDVDPRPRDLAAERAVLGAMMLAEEAIAEVLPILRRRDFYRPAHGVVYGTITDLFEAGEPTDPVSVMARLERDGNLLRVGGGPELHSLCAEVPTATSVAYWAELVAAAAARARLIDTSQRLAQLAHDPSDLAEVQEKARTAVEDATKRREDTEAGVWVGDVIDDVFASWEAEPEPGLPYPYLDVDQVTSMKPGQLIIVAARPAVGKSTVAMDCARYAARVGASTLFGSLEMSRGELIMRMACAEAKVRLADVQARSWTAADRLHIKGVAERIKQMPLRIEDQFGMTLGQLRSLAREVARGPRGLDFLVVDYLQLLTPADQRVSRREQVDALSRGLKALAKELHIPVMALSQLNRGLESRTDKKPVLSDLRESGSLEADADVVILISRPDATERDDPRAGEADLIFAKNRNGPTATITVGHQLHFCRFVDLARGGDRGDRAA